MEKMKKKIVFPRWGIIVCVAIFVILLLAILIGKDGRVRKTKIKTDTKQDFVVEDLHLSVTYGFDNYGRYGRDLQYTVKVENEGADFAGTLSIKCLEDNTAKAVAYEEGLQIAAGENKTFKFYLPAITYSQDVLLAVEDEKENYLGGSQFAVTLEEAISKSYIGIISEDESSMGYLSGNQNRLLYIKPEETPDDAKGLYTLDVLIINQIAGETFSAGQIQAIKDFVYQGGSLIIGTGDSHGKSLDVLSQDMLVGKMGDLDEYLPDRKQNTNKKKQEGSAIGYLNLDIEESTVILQDDEQKKPLIQMVRYGKGNVQVASIDLALEKEDWSGLGNMISESVTEHLSMQRKKIIYVNDSDETYVNWTDYGSIPYILATIGDAKLPNVRVYMVLLLVYIALIGPVLYFICKKKECRQRLLILIPACSLAFSLMIYFVGSGTRVRDRLLNYVTLLEYQEDGNLTEDSIVSVISNDNKAYDIEADEKLWLTLGEYTDRYSYMYASDTKIQDVDTCMKVRYDGEKPKVHINSQSVFETAYMSLQQSKEAKQDVLLDIRYEDGELKGTIASTFDCDLKDCCLVIGESVYVMHDLKAKEVRDLETDKPDLMDSDIYSFSYDLYGVDPYDSSYQFIDRLRTSSVLGIAREMEKESDSLYASYFIGTLDTNEPSDSVASLGIDTMNGVTLMAKPVQIKGRHNNKDIFLFIDNLEMNAASLTSSELLNGWLNREWTDIKYCVEQNKKPLKLVYSAGLNGNRRNEFFLDGGILYIYNYKTDDWEKIDFENGKDGEYVLTDDVIDSDNAFTLRYELPADILDKDAGKQRPIVSMTYEDVKADRR